jgi:hypothetical protein
MRKKSALLTSVGLALLVGLVGTAVVWARSGAEKNPPHAVARSLTEEEAAAGEEWRSTTLIAMERRCNRSTPTF